MGKKKPSVSWKSELSEKEIEFTTPDIMLKVISTVDPRGWPHITIITSNIAKTKNQVVWGQFSEGQSKTNILDNPKHGICYMSADMPFKIMQVKVDFTQKSSEGEDIERFNASPLMRYMTYMRVFHVYYGDINAGTRVRSLPLGGVGMGILKTMIGKGGAKTKLDEKRLNAVGYNIFSGPINPKFISYIDSDGYPVVFPCIQLQAADHNRLVFSTSALKSDLENIPIGAKVAVLGMTMDLANQHVIGTFTGIQKKRCVKLGIIDIEEIYNSCPPMPGVIYPEIYHRPKITDFHL